MVEDKNTEQVNEQDMRTAGDVDENNAPESNEASEEQVEKSEIEILTEQLEIVKAEAATNYERFLRASAEFENLRKRTEKERGDLLRFGAENLLRDLLQVVDSFEKALPEDAEDSHNSDEFLKGMKLVWKQMSDSLSKNGLKSIECQEAPFDPNLHQAIQRIEADDVDTEIVAQEFQKGYLLHERLLRPSMVSVKVPK